MLHAKTHFGPGTLQIRARCGEHRLGVAQEAQLIARIRAADDVRGQSRETLEHLAAVRAPDLDDRPELLRKQRGEHALEVAAEHQLRPALVALHVVSGFVIGEHVQVHGHADVGREGHLAHGREQAAVRPVVISENQALTHQRLHCGEEIREQFRLFQIGRLVSALAEHLRENRAAQAVASAPEIQENQFRLTGIGPQLRGQRPAHVRAGRKRRDDQRQGSDHLSRLPVFFPRGAHRKGILAHRDADPERRAQAESHRAHGIEQGRVFGPVARGGHPVCRELDSIEIADRSRRKIRERLAHRHAARGFRIDERERRALPHGERFSARLLEAHQGHRAVGDRRLPRPDERIARAQSAHRPVADAHQKSLARDGGVPQHPTARLGQDHVAERERGRVRPAPPDLARHARRLAEEHGQLHFDRLVPELPVLDYQASVIGHDADDGCRAALALADRLELSYALGGDGEHEALLGFIAPQLARRHAGLFVGHGAQIDPGTPPGHVDELRQRVRQPACADVVNGEHRIALAELPAAVDDLLGAPLHLGVAPLHRIEVQILRIGAGVHARRGAPAHPDQHSRTAEVNEEGPGCDRPFVSVRSVDVAESARDHDRLVVAADDSFGFHLEGAEVAREIGAAELVVEGGRAYRALEHDLQRRGDALGLSGVLFPLLHEIRNAQMRNREAAQSGLGFRAAAGGGFVADLAPRARRRPRKRRDRRGVVVGLALHQRMRELVPVPVASPGPRIEAGDSSPFHHRGVVGVRDHGPGRIARVSGLDHAEESFFLRCSVDDPRGIEDLVPAMLRVRLSEHRELHVGGVARDFSVVGKKIVDFIGREREPESDVGVLQRRTSARQHVHDRERLRPVMAEQRVGLVERAEHRFSHAVVNEPEDPVRIGLGRRAGKKPCNAPLDAANRFETAAAGDIARLRRPRRDGAQARHAEQHAAPARGRRLAVLQQALEHAGFARFERALGLDEMPVLCGCDPDRSVGCCEAGVEFIESEGGNRAAATQLENQRHEACR